MSVWLVRSVRLSFFGVALALLLVSRPLLAAQDEQTELVSSANYVYGQSMTFNLIARNMGNIEKATLYFRLGASPDSYAVEVPIATGSDVEASYSLDLTQTRLPPFGTITYWWVLDRTDGSTLRVPEQIVNYVDDQFNWRQLSEIDPQGGGSIRFYWTGDDEALGESARNITMELLPRLGDLIPLEMILPFDVYIYPSSADLSAALRLAGREYTPGQNYPDLNVLLVTVVNPQTAEAELRQGLARSLVDQLLYQSIGQYTSNLPPWLPTGLAGVVQDEWNGVAENSLRLALANNEPLPITDLCASTPVDGDLAVAESESLANFFLQVHGEDVLRQFLAGFDGGTDCPTVFQDVLGTRPEEFAGEWRQSWQPVDDQPRDMSSIIWFALVLAGFGLLTLLVLKPRR